MIIINILQLITSVLLIILILFQERGSGLSQTFGGGSESYGARRGMERWLFNFTVLVAVAFWAFTIIDLILR